MVCAPDSCTEDGELERKYQSTRVSLRRFNKKSRPDPFSMTETVLVPKCIPLALREPSFLS